jgi:hypothetical protein
LGSQQIGLGSHKIGLKANLVAWEAS